MSSLYCKWRTTQLYTSKQRLLPPSPPPHPSKKEDTLYNEGMQLSGGVNGP